MARQHRSRFDPLFLLLLAVLLGACSGAPVTSRPMPAPASSASTPVRGQYVIGCEESPTHCFDEAKRVCPEGYRTVQEGEGGRYADGEDWRHPPPVLRRRPYYRRQGWVIQCQGTGAT